MVIFALIMPFVMRLLLLRLKNPQMVDLKVAQNAIIFLIVGSITMGLAPSIPTFAIGKSRLHFLFASQGLIIARRLALVVYCLGSGYYSAIRSFVTSLVEKDEIGLLYTVIGMIDSIGTLVATPLVTIAFSFGVRTGGLLMGLPFFVVGALYMFSGVMTWCLKATKIDEDEEEEEHEE